MAVHEGDGYSFELPREWTQTSTKDNQLGFTAPDGTTAFVETTAVEPGVDLANPAVRQFILDTAINAFKLVMPGMAVQRSAPYQTGDIDGIQLVMSGTAPDGSTGAVVVTFFVQGESGFTVAMARENSAFDLSVDPDYNAFLESFRFED
jgi:hypothetical protein